ncbi:hypothetical protein SAMN04487968_101156 [Nocardioides terrae]|uniref:ATP synthase protein I n=1 Tax=Nocardioides terrae TaxID=574651 RepID=A0A1I1DIW5_9ACTN|nr:hypothetical protein [Nocardioides terrae]SFB72463.1 hypothetical protein SAMN04487968_101156 [Nocardioides terrae]
MPRAFPGASWIATVSPLHRTAAEMTTESKQVRVATGAGTLLGAASWALAIGAAVALVGLVVDGRPALAGGLTGAVTTAVVLAGGALCINVIARVMPSVSLMIALLTYALQVVVLTMVMAVVSESADDTVTLWAAVALIAVTLTWSLAHLLLSTRRRIAAYDVALPGEGTSGPDALSGAVRPSAR